MSQSTPQRLYLMQLLTASLPQANLTMVVACYLVQTNDGKNILIDTGLHKDAPAMPNMPPAQNQRDVVAQLADLGLQPQDIDILICTHFDMDHAGNHDLFTNAELIVQQKHYELAKSGHPRFAAAREHWDHPALRYRMVDGDVELLPGLKLIETSGHTLGHQSVLVHLPQTGPILLAIDAVSFARAFTPDRQAGPVDEDVEQLRASTRKLLEIAEQEHASLVVFGHDGQQWQSLTKAPQSYH